MNKSFGEILERLIIMRDKYSKDTTYGKNHISAYNKALKIVQEVAEEYKSTEHINCSSDTSTNGWISCSDGLPEDGTDVLVQFEYYRYGNYNRLFQTIGISYTYNGEWSGFVNGSSGWSDLRIIAWQPLPQPYKECD